MTTGSRNVLLTISHIISWLIFLALPTIFDPRRSGFAIHDFVDDILELQRWTNSLLLIAVFYFNYLIAIPKLYLRHKYLFYSLSFAGCFAAFLLLNFLIMPPNVRAFRGSSIKELGYGFNFFMFVIVCLFAFAICAYEQWQQTKEQMLNTEISFLKAQINPHFLFNTLNSIYALTLIKSERAPDAVVKLSGMMRYSVSEANLSLVPLSYEINYITNYIDLQKLRITDKIVITFEVTGEMEDKYIAPFLLIPFVENAFKYGVNAEENSDIWIKIEVNDSDLNMQIENNKVVIRKGKDFGASIGIKNTKKRLQLLYPAAHVLKIKDGKYDFSVSLYIKFR